MSRSQVFVGSMWQAGLEEAFRPTGEDWQVANNETALADPVERIRKLKPSLIVLEATGGVQVPVVAAPGYGQAAGGRNRLPTGA